MKILLVSSGSGSRGGGELFLKYLGEGLTERRHEVVMWIDIRMMPQTARFRILLIDTGDGTLLSTCSIGAFPRQCRRDDMGTSRCEPSNVGSTSPPRVGAQ